MREACIEWLLAACREWLGRAGPDPEAGRDLDWELLGRLAYVHNLEPLLHALARDGKLPPGKVPGALAARWEEVYFQNYIFNERLLEALDRLLDLVRRSGIAVAVFKGPVTAARAYRDPALRVMHDIDLLVGEADLEALCRLAREIGFDAGAETSVYHLALTDPGLGLGLELHFDLYGFLHGGGDLMRSILRAPAAVELEGRLIPAPRQEESVLLEVAHLVNHDFRVNLRPWLDLAALLTTAPLDRPRLRELAERHDLQQELELAAGVATELFGLRPGSHDFAPAAPARLSRQVLDLLSILDLDDRRPALAEAAARPHLAARIRYVRRLLFPPLSHLRALSGQESRAFALLAWPRHLAATVERGWRKWRERGLETATAAGPGSVKRRAYERREARR